MSLTETSPGAVRIMIFRLYRAVTRVLAGIVLVAVNALGATDRPTAPRAGLDQYCIVCHDQDAKTAGLALDTADPARAADRPEVWEKVVWKLRHRQMPPVGMPRPKEKAYQAIVSHLVASLDREAAANPNPGRTDTFRRLTRIEYRNVIRDLLALEVDVSALLPKDQSSHGFDNITVGDLSPTLLDRYLSAARKVSRLAVGSPVRSPTGTTILLPPDRTQEMRAEGLPFGTRGGTVAQHTFPVSGEYEIQLRLTRNRNEKVEGLHDVHQLEFTLDGRRIKVFRVEPPPEGEPHHLVDKDLNVRVWVEAGPHEVGAAFIKKSSALVETYRQPYLAHFNMDRHPRPQPALYSVSIIGPYEACGPVRTPSRQRIFVCYPESPEEEGPCAEKILSNLMRRAYRRPVTAADLEGPLSFYRKAREKVGFEVGIETALRAILMSPHFLFRIERDPPGTPPETNYRVSDIELASRLSFFLWSSIPDEELLDAAVRGELHKPEVLEEQVRRMLADPRAEALAKNFAGQWLYLRNLESARLNPRMFPDFDDNLRQAFRRETELLFQSVLREDRNVLDLLRADYTFLNERLAKHYGIPHVYGSRFRRIGLKEDSRRGGLLAQGSVLTVTSYATRTSPVIRGKWVLDNILGTPPPPPPPEVPELEEKDSGEEPQTLRERIAEHRANPACAVCHNVMDPIGFAFENYDAIGRWRTNDNGRRVDASGRLPDGTKFDGVSELQRALLKRPDLFVTTFVNKLLTYALGRGVEYYDAPAVRKIVRNAARDDYRFSSVILGIVQSVPFQMRRSQ